MTTRQTKQTDKGRQETGPENQTGKSRITRRREEPTAEIHRRHCHLGLEASCELQRHGIWKNLSVCENMENEGKHVVS